MPDVEVVETPSRVATPPAQAAEEPRVEVHDIPSPHEEPVVENTREGARKELFDSVEKVHKNRKYLKASSSFSEYNIGQAFTRGANDIVMVSFFLVTLT